MVSYFPGFFGASPPSPATRGVFRVYSIPNILHRTHMWNTRVKSWLLLGVTTWQIRCVSQQHVYFLKRNEPEAKWTWSEMNLKQCCIFSHRPVHQHGSSPNVDLILWHHITCISGCGSANIGDKIVKVVLIWAWHRYVTRTWPHQVSFESLCAGRLCQIWTKISKTQEGEIYVLYQPGVVVRLELAICSGYDQGRTYYDFNFRT